MAATHNPMQASTSLPAVSKTTIHMYGLLCDVYGLEELATQKPSAVSCLWLHHPRLRAKEDMADFANRVVSQWAQRTSGSRTGSGATSTGGRALIAVAFDQRNHGSRIVSPTASDSWREGNKTHALDMYGMVSGMVSDTQALMDVVEGYIKLEVSERGAVAVEEGWGVDQHLVMGVSLGGHSAWQTLFKEEKVTAGVVIIGCPDYMALLSDRAKKSRLATFSAADNGASFLGSKDFPADLVAACLRNDPKGILFGTGTVPASSKSTAQSSSLSVSEEQRLRGVLDSLHLKGKKFLVCSGADDKLVPYAMSEPFVSFFEEATRTWYADAEIMVENKVYDGVGHAFSEGMVEDSCQFLLDAVAAAGDAAGSESKAKI